MAKSLRIHGVAVSPDAPFKSRAAVVSSGVFSSLPTDLQQDAVDQLCESLGIKEKKQKPGPVEVPETPEQPPAEQ